jgi:hypothetical protein
MSVCLQMVGGKIQKQPEKDMVNIIGRKPVASIGFVSMKGELKKNKKMLKIEDIICKLKKQMKNHEQRGARK